MNISLKSRFHDKIHFQNKIFVTTMITTPTQPDLELLKLHSTVEKSGEHAPGTPEAFPRNTSDKNSSKNGLNHVSSKSSFLNGSIYDFYIESPIALYCITL